MSVTVTGETIHDVRMKVGVGTQHYDIRIKWRYADFARNPAHGCIVEVDGLGEDIPRGFDTTSKAIQYLKAIFKKRDKWIYEQEKKNKEAKKTNGKSNG